VFTGLVQHLGSVARVEPSGSGRTLVIDMRDWSYRPVPGESIAVNGCCLTVAAEPASDQGHDRRQARFDVVSQTLKVTTLGKLAAGDQVNLEHAATPTTLLGGHMVQGHVDGVGTVQRVQRDPADYRLRIVPPHPREAMRMIVERGSIALNGVSLTIASVADEKDPSAAWFEVALIPTTLALTNLGLLGEGDAVNIEYDCIARMVANWLARARPAE